MAWLFGKNKNKAESKKPNDEVLEVIGYLQEYSILINGNIDWWYNRADKSALTRQLKLYSTGQLKRLEKWSKEFEEAIDILIENKYSNLQDIHTYNAIIMNVVINRKFINWCYENGKEVDQYFKIYSMTQEIFQGDEAIVELMLCKQPWRHSDGWQTAWTLKTNYHTWMNEYYGFNEVGNYKQNIINRLHLEAIIMDSMMDSKLNKTNYNKVFQTLVKEERNSFNLNVLLHYENNQYKVYINNSLVTSYVKEATALTLKQEIENIINKLQ